MNASALEYCQAEVREHDHDRYLLALVAGGGVRADYWAILAFHLEIARAETSVSEVMLGEMRLQWWRDVIESLYQGHPRRHYVVEAMDLARQRGHLKKEDLLALVDGYGPIVAGREPKTIMEFKAQAHGVAGNLIRLLVSSHGVMLDDRGQKVIDAAAVSWSVAAAIRAQGRLSKKRRLAVPLEILKNHDVDVEDIYRSRINQAVGDSFAEFTKLGRAKFQFARRNIRHIPRRGRTPLLLATVGNAYLRAFTKRQYDPFGSPLTLNAGLVPLLLAVKGILRKI